MSPVKSKSISTHFEAKWKSGSPEKKRKRSCYFETLWSKYVVDGEHRSKEVRIRVENITRAAGLPVAFKARPRTEYVSPIQRWGIRKVQKRTKQRQRRVGTWHQSLHLMAVVFWRQTGWIYRAERDQVLHVQIVSMLIHRRPVRQVERLLCIHVCQLQRLVSIVV
jgi:hypothetical protein